MTWSSATLWCHSVSVSQQRSLTNGSTEDPGKPLIRMTINGLLIASDLLRGDDRGGMRALDGAQEELIGIELVEDRQADLIGEAVKNLEEREEGVVRGVGIEIVLGPAAEASDMGEEAAHGRAKIR